MPESFFVASPVDVSIGVVVRTDVLSPLGLSVGDLSVAILIDDSLFCLALQLPDVSFVLVMVD